MPRISINFPLTILLQARPRSLGSAIMWPTTLGFFFGMLTSFGVLCVIPDFEGFNMMERVKWALTAGVLIAYGVTYALPVAA
jgi:type II secretory pathway component PulF